VLSFTGGTNSFGGKVAGAGTFQLASGTDTFASGVALTAANVALTGANLALAANLTFAGAWMQSAGTLALGGTTLTLSGTADLDGGVINGAGTLAVTGTGEVSALFLEGSAVLKNQGNIVQDNYWYLGYNSGDTSSLNNASGATFTIANNNSIDGSSGASLANAGTLIKAGGSGLSSIAVATINTGVVEVGSGSMAFLNTVSGLGSFDVGAGTTLKFGAAVAAGSAVTLGANADLFVDTPAGFAGSIAGFSAGNLIELTGLSYSGASFSFNSALDQLTVSNSSSSIGLQLVGSYSASDFRLLSDNGVAAIAHT